MSRVAPFGLRQGCAQFKTRLLLPQRNENTDAQYQAQEAASTRRVICHPQLNGAPCPRCAEKDIQCTTTPVPRGRPRKNLVPASPESQASSDATQNLVSRTSSASPTTMRSDRMSECPDLTPSLVAHLFHCFERTPQAGNPIVASTSIRTTIRTVSFQLHLLPPQSRVLTLCIIAFSSLVSFHEIILGEGPRPESISDQAFFSSGRDVLRCGARRSVAYNALRLEALRAAWDSEAMLQVSNENAATCFVLDVLEQLDSSGPSRPWAAAYISHLRALAPVWRSSALTTPDGNHWGGFLCTDGRSAPGDEQQETDSIVAIFIPALNRRLICVNVSTRGDQVLLTGPEPPSPESLLGSLESFSRHCGTALLLQSMKPYHARLNPVSEAAVIQVLASLSIIHAIRTRLLEHADAALLNPASMKTPWPLPDDDRGLERNCAFGISLGFAMIALPLYHELEYRDRVCSVQEGGHTQRMRLLRAQAREMAILGAREFARAIRYLPPIHFVQIKLSTVRDYARFAHDEAEGARMVSLEQVQDLDTIAGELVLSGYSLDLPSSPEDTALLDRLATFMNRVRRLPEFIAPNGALDDMFFPGDQIWFVVDADSARHVWPVASETLRMSRSYPIPPSIYRLPSTGEKRYHAGQGENTGLLSQSYGLLKSLGL
ncbi:hypothetical protein FB451DRAFT_1446811 [Mycena latifolia]|nr:hypothetical protein FB451DRAFT_1446811 [Mycena latifolia]